MDSKTRRCCVCGKEYKYCNQCLSDKNKPTWMFAWCSENCKDIYNATSDFEDGNITANEAKAKLDNLDLSRFEYFGNSYKNSISKINKEIENETHTNEEIVFKKDIIKAESEETKENLGNFEVNNHTDFVQKKKNYYKRSKETENNVEE